MASDQFAYRFGGTRRLYGTTEVEVLRRAHVCVIGIGGVGSWAVEALARTAVGKLTLIDLDDVCVSNTNRQIHAMSNTVGQPKVEVMAERVRQINPDCEVEAITDFVTERTLETYLARDYDYVLDAIDSVKVKAAMIAFCKRRKIPIFCVGGAGGQMDPTQIQTGDLNRTYNDPLLAKVRSLLRRQYGFSRNSKRRYSVECVFSSEQLVYPQADGSVCQQKPQEEEGPMRLDCASGFGAATCVTASFGFVAVARIIRKILDKAARQPATAVEAEMETANQAAAEPA